MRYLTWIISIGLLLLPAGAAASTVNIVSKEANLILHTAKVAHITGTVDEQSALQFITEMEETAFIPGDRLIIINSPGGSVGAGYEMLRMIEMEQAQGTRVVCYVAHFAHSMAFNILTRCDIRLASPKASMLVHKIEAVGLESGEWHEERLTAQALRRIANNLDQTDEPFRKANAHAMHLSLKEYDMYANNETYWISSILLAKHYLDGFGEIVK